MGKVTAKNLFQNSSRSVIKNIVDEQVRIIDAKILSAHSAGFNHVAHELPVSFSINNMTKSDIQMLVYSELIEIYKEKGFDVNIEYNYYIHIYWSNGITDDERKYRMDIIKQHSMKAPLKPSKTKK